MYDKSGICNKIREIYPQMGVCDRDVKVQWSDEHSAWAVDFKKDGHAIRHYLDDADAASCVDRSQCIAMGVEFGQFL